MLLAKVQKLTEAKTFKSLKSGNVEECNITEPFPCLHRQFSV